MKKMMIACAFAPVLAFAANDPLVGSWGFTIPGDYDDIGEKVIHMAVTKNEADGTYAARMLWRWGSPEMVKNFKVEGNKFTLEHPYGANVEGSFEGDKMWLHYTFMLGGKLKDSRKILPEGSKGLEGHRNPEAKDFGPVDTRAAKLGNPIDLLKDGMDGWELMPGKGRNCWSVKDGVLSNDVGKNEKGNWKGGGLNLRTKRADFYDFNLEYDVRVPKNANSGVYLRGRYEIQTVDSYGSGKKTDEHSMCAYYGYVKPSTDAAKKPDEWQHVYLTLYKQHLTVWLNGVEIIRNAPIVGITGGAIDAEEQNPGPIYIQGDHSNADYRNIILRPVVK